ncbi:MAG: hypothetical protein ACK4ZJ_18635, partial [Allorhizobium sp.]
MKRALALAEKECWLGPDVFNPHVLRPAVRNTADSGDAGPDRADVKGGRQAAEGEGKRGSSGGGSSSSSSSSSARKAPPPPAQRGGSGARDASASRADSDSDSDSDSGGAAREETVLEYVGVVEAELFTMVLPLARGHHLQMAAEVGATDDAEWDRVEAASMVGPQRAEAAGGSAISAP